MSGDGRGCNTSTGFFTVLDLAPDRLWIVYEQHCEGGDAAVFGEIRLGYGEATDPLGVEAGILAFPSDYPGVPVRPVPIRVTNNGAAATSVTSAIKAGAADFSIVSNGCSASLAPGASCTVHVGWTASRPGVRLGLLEISDSRGGFREISLSAIGTSGRTRWQMSGDAGDYISQGRSYTYTPQMGARMGGGGTETYASMGADYGDDWWGARFQAPKGQILLPGKTYTGATRYPFNSGNAGLDVSGSGRGCNTLTGQFTVHEATYDNGILTGFRISFEQHCEGATPALRGELSWRALDPDAPRSGHDAARSGHRPHRRCRGRLGAADVDQPDGRRLGRHGHPRRERHQRGDGGPARVRRPAHVDGRDRLPDVAALHAHGLHRGHVRQPEPRPHRHHPGDHDRTATAPSADDDEPDTDAHAHADCQPHPDPEPRAPAPTTQPSPTAPSLVRAVSLQATRVDRRDVRLTGRSGTWAAGERALLQRRTDRGWSTVATRRFSPSGRVRFVVDAPRRGAVRYRLVARTDGPAVVSPAVRVRP